MRSPKRQHLSTPSWIPLTRIGQEDGRFSDFYLKEFGLYVEVCGAQRDDYQRRKEIYKKNDIEIIFIETYKGSNKWQYFLNKSIKEFKETQHKKWTELNLINNNLEKTEKKNIDTKEIEDNNKTYSQIVEEIDKLFWPNNAICIQYKSL